jgi:hypothetical protein
MSIGGRAANSVAKQPTGASSTQAGWDGCRLYASLQPVKARTTSTAYWCHLPVAESQLSGRATNGSGAQHRLRPRLLTDSATISIRCQTAAVPILPATVLRATGGEVVYTYFTDRRLGWGPVPAGGLGACSTGLKNASMKVKVFSHVLKINRHVIGPSVFFNRRNKRFFWF